MSNNGRTNALTFLTGAAIGGAAALLLAPMSGRELRTRIGEEAEATKDAAKEKVQEISTRANETVRDLSEKANRTYERSRDRASELVENGQHAAAVRRDAVGEAFRAGLEAYEKALRAS